MMRANINNNRNTSGNSRNAISVSNILAFFIIILLTGVIAVCLYAPSLHAASIIINWILLGLLTGTATGFLFGIPKIHQDESSRTGNTSNTTYRQVVNTNLVEISDWLTKIIVGLGLIHLHKIVPYITGAASQLASGLKDGNADNALAFSYGIVIAYPVLGFLFGYLTTRMFLAPAFSRADQDAIRVVEEKIREAQATANSAITKAEFASYAAPLRATPLAANETGAGNNYERQLDDLVNQFNQLRITMKSGPMRTRKLSAVMGEMVKLMPHLPGYDVARALQDSNNGRRLSAYASLYAEPQQDLLLPLTDALLTTETTAFGQYWGIITIGKLIALQTQDEIRETALAKLQTLYSKLDPDTDRHFELKRILDDQQADTTADHL